MAEINVGEVNVEGGRYEVILRRVGAMNQVRPNGEGMVPPNWLGANQNEENGEVANQAPMGNFNRNPGGGGKKAKKGKSTRKLSGYMKFAQEARPRILKENPEMKSDIPGMGRKIGEMWRALSDSEKAKY